LLGRTHVASSIRTGKITKHLNLERKSYFPEKWARWKDSFPIQSEARKVNPFTTDASEKTGREERRTTAQKSSIQIRIRRRK